MLSRSRHVAASVVPCITGVFMVGAGAFCADKIDAHMGVPQTFNTDLEFKFGCKGYAYPISDEAVEAFFKDKGFKTVNIRRELRKKQLPRPFDFFVEGMDSQLRLVRFVSPVQTGWNSTGWYSVGLYSCPPAKHDRSFEDEVFAFVTKTLGCEVRDVHRDA